MHAPATGQALTGSSVVAIGEFNPVIFQPAWFTNEGMVRPDEFESSQVLVTNEAAIGQGRTFGYQVLRDRCTLYTLPDAPTPDTLRDLAVGVFTLLPYPPIRQLGLNHSWHMPPNEAQWASLQSALVQLPGLDGILTRSQASALELRSDRTDDYIGHIVTQLQPSAEFAAGVWLNVNNHIELVPPDAPPLPESRPFLDALDAVWDAALALARNLADWTRRYA